MLGRSIFGKQIVIASHNLGKVREISALLAPFGLKINSAAMLNLPEPAETGVSFAENAAIKANAAQDTTGLLSIADDSGLVVPALGGAPGIYSARWAGSERNFGTAILRVIKELGNKDPAACFVCALALTWPDGFCEHFEGKVHGTLVFPPRGENGFGYDPIFRPNGSLKTFGEMLPDTKESMSHRARAFVGLRQQYTRAEFQEG